MVNAIPRRVFHSRVLEDGATPRRGGSPGERFQHSPGSAGAYLITAIQGAVSSPYGLRAAPTP